MKQILLTAFAVILMFGANAQGSWYGGSTNTDNSGTASLSGNNSAPSITWLEKSIDLGEVKEFHQKEVVFEMKNTGGKPVMILDAKKSCGCTEVDFTRKPIMPGKSTKITVTYDAEELGVFKKEITLTMSEGTPSQVLYFNGEVVK